VEGARGSRRKNTRMDCVNDIKMRDFSLFSEKKASISMQVSPYFHLFQSWIVACGGAARGFPPRAGIARKSRKNILFQ
jgi:hypothetical protein